MKVRYEFVNGEISEIEVDKSLGELLVDFDRQEYNNDHKETRRHSSMDALAEQGVQFAAEQDALAALFQESSRTDMLREAIKTLKPAQQRLVQAVYYGGVSVKDYAAREGVDPSAITHRLRTIKNKLKKLL